MIGFGKTDVGTKRENNEDSIFISNERVGSLPNLFIVADGMGGHNAGEIASSEAVRFFCESIKGNNAENDEVLDCIFSGISYANEKIFELSESMAKYKGMGTTFTVCAIDGKKLYIGHIGDSRVYIVNKIKTTQITTDHTYVRELLNAGRITEEQLKTHPSRNVITKALGISPDIMADGKVHTLKANDYVLICSDGLSNMLTDEEISEITIGKASLADKADALINLANEKGGIDNISVVVISMKGVPANEA